MMEMLEQRHPGQGHSTEKEKYAIIHNVVRSISIGFKNIFPILQFTWQEMQIFEKKIEHLQFLTLTSGKLQKTSRLKEMATKGNLCSLY